MARKLGLLFAVVGSVVCSTALALGLGSIESRSLLNEPLSAKIPLHSVGADELESLTAALASGAAFARAGMERPFYLSRLKFEVIEGPPPYIHITTEKPLKEPFVDFLLEISWRQGRMVREYTLLLDPPIETREERAAPASRPAMADSAQSESDQPAAEAAAATARAQAAQPARGAAREVAEQPQRYRVQANDTLWGMAQQLRADRSVSIHQAMLALYRANPHAFADGDMNRLLRGSVLRVPDAEAQREVASSQASRDVQRLLASRSRTPRAESEATPASAERPAAPERGRLQVVAPTGGEESGGESVTGEVAVADEQAERLERELSVSRETELSLRSQNAELQEQVEGLKQEIAALERMVNLQVQQRAAQAEEAPSASEPAEVVEARAEPEPAAEVVATSARSPIVPEPFVEDEPGLLQDWRTMAMLGAGVLGLLAVLLFALQRRRMAAEAAGDAPVTLNFEADAAEATESTQTASAAPEAQPSEGQDPAASIDEALSEADLYLAHGRYEQAEEVVGHALEQAPQNKELRLKLLEILALTANRPAFEAQAEILQAQVSGEDDPVWTRAVEMGREMAPEHPFFSVPSGEASGDDWEEESLLPDTEFETPAAQSEHEPQAQDEDFALDFPLDEPSSDSDAQSESEEVEMPEVPVAEEPDGSEFSFDLDEESGADTGSLEFDEFGNLAPERAPETQWDEPATAEEQAPEVDTETAAAPEHSEELSDLDFDFDLGKSESAEAPVEESFDVDAFEQVEDAEPVSADALEGDEVATKLDLARAYIDMGDNEGARGLLDEVVEEGNADQRGEAESLLAELS